MKIAVFGAKGRVGSRVCKIARLRGHEIVEIEVDSDTEKAGKVDVAIDFSTANATEKVCKFCKNVPCPLVTGVTGRNDGEMQILEETKRIIAVEDRANFSIGMEKMLEICKILGKLGWDCEIVETHRKGKKDSPSGTAKQLASAIAEHTRTVTIHSLRAGSNFGTHEVIFATNGESLTVTHRAENVDIFALGAIKCAEELVKKEIKD